VTDGGKALLWLLAAAGGAGLALAWRRRGLPAAQVRDLVHLGAGAWVLGWPAWRSAAVPVTLAAGIAAFALALPFLAPRLEAAARFAESVTAGDERLGGVALFGASFAAFTAWGLLAGPPFPAAAALLALSLGDGMGGAVGRRFGRHHYRAPFAKQRSLEGSLAVALFGAAGVAIAAARFGASPGALAVAVAGLAAAVAEALSPRASDNALVPLAVFAALSLA
jgi:dolichol kinase